MYDKLRLRHHIHAGSKGCNSCAFGSFSNASGLSWIRIICWSRIIALAPFNDERAVTSCESGAGVSTCIKCFPGSYIGFSGVDVKIALHKFDMVFVCEQKRGWSNYDWTNEFRSIKETLWDVISNQDHRRANHVFLGLFRRHQVFSYPMMCLANHELRDSNERRRIESNDDVSTSWLQGLLNVPNAISGSIQTIQVAPVQSW